MDLRPVSVAKATARPCRFAAFVAFATLIGCVRPATPAVTDAISSDSTALASAIAAGMPATRTGARVSGDDSVPEWVSRYFGPRLDTGQVIRGWEIVSDSGWPMRIVRVPHARADDSWPYGAALAALRPDSTFRWIGDFRGDFVPYRSIHWLDANGDGQRDLYMIAGEEEEFNTWIYVDRGDGGAFIEALYDNRDYLGVVDLDGDGIPEFLGTAFNVEPSMGDDDPCASVGEPGLPAPFDTLAWNTRRDFSNVNFSYGMGETFGVEEAFKDGRPVRIWSVRGTAGVDVTARFHAHLDIRRRYLEGRRQVATGPCRAKLDSVGAYLDSVTGGR